MKKASSPTRFLTLSLIVVAVLCILVFGFLALYMDSHNKDTINEVGAIYMTGMSERITMHFDTTIDYNLSQLQGVADAFPPDSRLSAEELREQLIYDARARGFTYLAFYSQDGEIEPLFGPSLQLSDPKPFLESLNQNRDRIAVATTPGGSRMMVLGVPASYDMDGGKTCTALLGALPMEYIQKILSLDTMENESSLVYCHVIRRDGSFVIRSGDAFQDSYFERVRALFEGLNEAEAEQHVANLQKAMSAGEPYSNILNVKGERRHLYCTSLPYSNWYLVTVMPFGRLDLIVNQLSSQWIGMVLGSCAIILCALLLVFAKYFSITHQQITALADAKAQAEQASKAKSEFLSNMSHDIRTPMNAIVGMTAIATANLKNPQQVQNCLRKIALSSKHLLGLINDVLDMSKIESGKLTLSMDLLSLREVMDSIVNIVQPQVRAKNQHFDVSVHSILAENVLCDGVRLNQVLINLLSNAVKFTPDGGSIHIALYQEPSPKGDAYIRSHILVQDNGIGMAPEFQEKIFDSFVREDRTRVQKTEGTGLGMAITKYIIDMMEGSIELKSTVGEGTEFHVTLDLEKADTPELEMILPNWRMLVVDDDEVLCQSTADSLKEIGIDADWTLDGESAIRMVERQHQLRDNYHIILLDWKLPGMDGIQTARELRRRCGDDVPILLISAYDWGEIEAQARDAGISGFISKPLFKSTLFYGLRQFASGGKEGAPSPEAVPSQERVDLTGRHVLLAEDNDLNWEIAAELLAELGLVLDRAENGQICVDMFLHSNVGYYDAVLMDVRMPVMTGIQATEAIRAMGRSDAKEIPIIAMTADAFAEDVQRCLDCGMNAHVAKPIDVDTVARLLEKHIRMRKG